MADNLLDKASILLTPTAYNDGSMLSVKPENGDGDFDFSRSSAATRVNAQGLVENVQIISPELVSNGDFSQIGTEEVLNGNFSQEGSELVTNGDFSNGLANWVVDDGTSWTNVNDTAFCDGNNGLIRQNITSTQNKVYKVTFDTIATNSSGKELGVRIDAGTYAWNSYSTGTHTIYLTAGSNGFEGVLFYATGGWTGSIDNVSVKEVGQNWSFSSGATLTSLGAKITHAPTAGSIGQSNILTIGKQYKLTYEITESIYGGLKFNSAVDSSMVTSVGVHTKYLEADGTTAVFSRTDASNNDVTITNISIKEVGQDWTLGTGWSIGDGKATTDGTINSNCYQDAVTTIGQTYKYSFDVLDSGSGVIDGRFRNGGGVIQSFSSEGTYTGTFVAYNTLADFTTLSGNTASFSITNVSVKEITDDTDLPRINYEGFSYQDSLGSEQISNGAFGTDSNWTKGTGFSINSGSANCDGTQTANTFLKQQGGILGSTINFVVGKTYKVNYDIIVTSGLIANIEVASGYDSSIINTSGNHTAYITAVSTNNRFTFTANPDFVGSIDNVSVKEVLGQEVVPDSGCGSWLLEPQSTNLVTYSEDFSTGSWTNNGVGTEPTITNGFLAPDGTNSASKISNPNNDSLLQLRSVTPLGGTKSIYAKTTGGSGQLHLLGGQNDSSSLYTITENWQRFENNRTDITTHIYAADFRGSSTLSEVIVWGAQVEALPYATSYIPTNGATNTRLQDIATNSGNASLINSTEGVLYAEISGLANYNLQRWLSLSNGTTSNTVKIGIDGSTTDYRFVFEVRSGAVLSAYMTYNFGAVEPTFVKVAVKYKENDFALWINGVEVATDTSGSAPIGLSQLNFDRGDGAQKFEGKAKALVVFPILTDAELQSLTTI